MACKVQTTARAGKPAVGVIEKIKAFIVTKDSGMTPTFIFAARNNPLHGEHRVPRP